MTESKKNIHPAVPANILSFEVEDRFHDGYRKIAPKDVRSRILPNLIHLLDLLDNQKTAATFFILGCVAEQFPEVVALIDARGHEVASHGYSHDYIEKIPPEKLADELTRSKTILEDVIQKQVLGFRPHQSFSRNTDPVIIETAARVGYSYFSGSLLKTRYLKPNRPVSTKTDDDSLIDIIPQSVFVMWGMKIGFSEKLRVYPSWFIQRAISRLGRQKLRAIINLKLWELDRNQLRPAGSDYTDYARYGNLNLVEEKLTRLLDLFEFSSFEKSLGLISELKPDPFDETDSLQRYS